MSGMIIQTNILAINALRSIKNVGKQNANASARLSSGLRINSGSDDAAGLPFLKK